METDPLTRASSTRKGIYFLFKLIILPGKFIFSLSHANSSFSPLYPLKIFSAKFVRKFNDSWVSLVKMKKFQFSLISNLLSFHFPFSLRLFSISSPSLGGGVDILHFKEGRQNYLIILYISLTQGVDELQVQLYRRGGQHHIRGRGRGQGRRDQLRGVHVPHVSRH